RAQPEGVDQVQGRRSGRELRHHGRAEHVRQLGSALVLHRPLEPPLLDPRGLYLMLIHRSRMRWAGLVAAAFLTLGCDVKQELLSPQQPGVIGPDDVNGAGATGANALYVGARGRVTNLSAGGAHVYAQTR